MTNYKFNENIPPNRRWSLGFIKRRFTTESEDLESARGRWSGKADFFLSCLGFAVGLGNVWRFPYLCYRNGGGAFLVPYFIFLFGVGIPLMILEFTIGQFSSTGPYRAWEFVLGLRGIGLVMSVLSMYISLYYVVIIAWALWYFFMSFSGIVLPWAKCGSWSTQLCEDRLQAMNLTMCTGLDLTAFANGTCHNITSGTLVGIYNKQIALEHQIKPHLPSSDYLNYVGLQTALSSGIENIGNVRWDMSLCLLLAWILVFAALISGIQTSGKVVYFTATFPYVLLVILLICGTLQEGSMKGIEFYLKPNVTKLGDPQVWKDAASQIFFSLSLSVGGLTMFASYNRFKKDIVRDAVMCSLCNCGTSFFAGFVIFSFLGGFADNTGTPIENVVADGVDLAFVVYAQACTKLPAQHLWAILFYFMLMILGLDSAFGYVETIVMCMAELKLSWIRYRRFFLLIACVGLFLLGQCMATPGGVHVLTLLDQNSMSFNVIFLALLECVAVWIYGPWRLLEDIHLMVGDMTMKYVPWKIAKWGLISCYCVISPAILLFIFLFGLISYKTPNKSPLYITIGQIIMISTLVPLFVNIVVTLIKAKGTLKERIKSLLQPSVNWGPYALKHRKLVTYVDGFVVNPRGLTEENPGIPPQNTQEDD